MAEFSVDQSGKWEEPGPTAIGVQGPRNYSLLVDRHSKQEINSMLRKMSQEKGRSKAVYQVRVFAYTVFFGFERRFPQGRCGDNR